MSWNYRIIRHMHSRGDFFALHEVYYDNKGKVKYWSADPITFQCDVDEGSIGISKALDMAYRDAKKYPVLLGEDLPGARYKKGKAKRK